MPSRRRGTLPARLARWDAGLDATSHLAKRVKTLLHFAALEQLAGQALPTRGRVELQLIPSVRFKSANREYQLAFPVAVLSAPRHLAGCSPGHEKSFGTVPINVEANGRLVVQLSSGTSWCRHGGVFCCPGMAVSACFGGDLEILQQVRMKKNFCWVHFSSTNVSDFS